MKLQMNCIRANDDVFWCTTKYNPYILSRKEVKQFDHLLL